METIVTVARRELDKLETELRADPRHRKIASLRALLEEYGDSASPLAYRQASVAPANGTKKAAMLAAITNMLSDGGYTHRSRILNSLVDAGIMGGEKNGIGHLAAFLSDHRDSFESDGRGNFRLRSTQPAEAESADTDRSLFETGRNADQGVA